MLPLMVSSPPTQVSRLVPSTGAGSTVGGDYLSKTGASNDWSE